jgi:hypothetical protein
MHHKRKRPKHQRSGCLWCSPHKDERRKKAPRSKRARALLAEPVVSFDRFCTDMGLTK